MSASGTPVWLPAGDEWIPALKIRDSVAEGQLVGSEGLVVCLREDTGEETVVPRDVLSHREELPPGGGVDDLTQLAFLNEASILDNLHQRYGQNGEDHAQRPRIYTYCGRILLAANPFQPMPQLYTPDTMQRYHRAARLNENPPHVFAIAAAAFSAMMHRHGGVSLDQSILISGESGAGKTESAKLIMDYLATVSASAGTPAADRPQSTVESDRAEQQSRKLRQLFEAIDVDGSGSLSSAEIGRLCTAMGSSLSPSELQQAMTAIDTDHNGNISFEEFVAWRTKLQVVGALPVTKDPDAVSPRTGAPMVSATSSVARSVVQTNPLLEAFGNARTLRNANSSRFGKMTRILFNHRGAITGARADVYLLEKSRVCRQAVGERNFHIFYQLLAGADDTTLDGLGLVGVRSVVAGQAVRTFKALTPKPASSTHRGQIKVGGADVNRRLKMTKKFTQLRADLSSSHDNGSESKSGVGNSSTSVNETSERELADDTDDASGFRVVCNAMQTVGIDSEERMCFFRVVAAVLLLGEVTFETDTGRSGEEIATLAAPRRGDLSSNSLPTVAMLLSVDPDELAAALLSRTSRAGTEQLVVQLGQQAAAEARDALAKSLYANLFTTLVARINANNGGAEPSTSSIGVLDIFGFESFASNSLEQLLINYANEKLQQQFTWYVFTLEQEEYVREGIAFDAVEYQDNSPILDLLEGSGGVLALVEEECRMQRGTDANFMEKLKQFQAPSVEVHLRKPGAPPEATVTFPRLQNDLFTVRHYAGDVTYTARGFRDKSMDHVHLGATTMMRSSTDPFVANLFVDASEFTVESPEMTSSKSRSIFGGRSTPSKGTPGKASRRTLSVGMQFKTQLGGLMDEINCTQAHFVRCIKPNSSGTPCTWDAPSVLEQLRCQGILEAIRIARAMFPNRMKHADFISAYSICLRDAAGGGIGNASQLWSAAHVERLLQPAPEEPESEPMNAFDVFSAIEEIDTDEDEPSQQPSPEPAKKTGFGFGAIFSGSKKNKDREQEKQAREKQLKNEREATEMERSKAARLIDLLETFDQDQAVLGQSKVFLRSEAFEVLESRRQRVQALFALRLQKAARGFLARARCRRLRTAAIILQSACRSGAARKRFLATQKAAVCLQACRRGAKGRKALRELHMNRSATMIASNARAWRARAQYVALRRASVTAQKSARCKLAQLRYNRLRDEARESARLEGRLATVEREFASLSDENSRLQQELMQATAAARAEVSREWETKIQQIQRQAAEAEEGSVAAKTELIAVQSELHQEQQLSRARVEQVQTRSDAELKLVSDEATEARRALSEFQEQVQVQTMAQEAELSSLRQQAKTLEGKRQQETADALERFAAGEHAQKEIDAKQQSEYVDNLMAQFEAEKNKLEERCKALQTVVSTNESDLNAARESLQTAQTSMADEVSRLQAELENRSDALTELESSRKADQSKFMTAMQATEKRFAESEAEIEAVATAKAESASKAAEAERIAIASELEASVAELTQMKDLHMSEHETNEASFAQERKEMENALKAAQDAQAVAETALADATRHKQQSTHQWREQHEEAEGKLERSVAQLREAEVALVAERQAAHSARQSHEITVKKLQETIDSLHEEATARQEQYAARQEERERIDAEQTAANKAQITKLETDAAVALETMKAAEDRLQKENANLSEQVESLQTAVATKAAGTSEMVQQIQAQLREAKAERDNLAQQLVQQQAETTALQNDAKAGAAAAAQKLASSIAAEREALAVTHRQEVELIKLEAEADAEDLRNQIAKANEEVESLSKQIENLASSTQEKDAVHHQELTEMKIRAEHAESRLQELQAVARMEEGAAAEQEAAAKEKQTKLETELQELHDANIKLEEKLLIAQQHEAEDHALLSQKLDSALTAVQQQAEETEAALVRHTEDKKAALEAAAVAHAAAVEQVRVEAAEAAIESGVELHYELDKAVSEAASLRTQLSEAQEDAQAAELQLQRRLEAANSTNSELASQQGALESTIENLRRDLEQQRVDAQQAAYEAAEAGAAELQAAVASATQDAGRALRSTAEAEISERLEVQISQLTSDLEAERTAMADAEAAREAEALMLAAQGEAREAAEQKAAWEAEQMADALRNAEEDATTARAAAKQAELLAAQAARSLAKVEEERNTALTSLNQLSNARKAEVATAAEELKALREALSKAEERASVSATETLVPPPSPGPPPEVTQTINALEADVATAEAKATDAIAELKELRKDKATARERIQCLEAQVGRLTEDLRCAREAATASTENDEALKERQMKVKYMKENDELVRTVREATERASRMESVVCKYRSAAEDAAAQLRAQAESEERTIEMRRELRESPAAKRRSSIPRVSRLVEQRQRLQKEADNAAEIIARGQEARQQHWSTLAQPVRTVSTGGSGSKSSGLKSPPRTAMREHSPTERNQSRSPRGGNTKKQNKGAKNAGRVPREDRWDHPGTPAQSGPKTKKRARTTERSKAKPAVAIEERQSSLEKRIAELQAQLGLTAEQKAEDIGSGLPPRTPPRTPNQIGGPDREHSPRFVALRRSLTKQIESSGQKSSTPASHGEALEAANQLRQAIASGDPEDVAASAAAIRESSNAIIKRATSKGSPPPATASASGTGARRSSPPREISKVQRTLLEAELEVAKGELLSLLAAPGNSHGKALGRRQPPPRRTLAMNVDTANTGAITSDDEDDGADPNNSSDEESDESTDDHSNDEEELFDRSREAAGDLSPTKDPLDYDSADKENEPSESATDSEDDPEDESRKGFFERYAEDNARRRWHRQRLSEAKAEEEEAETRWKSKTTKRVRQDSDKTWNKVREAQQLKRAYLEERRRRAAQAELEMCRKTPLTKKSRELADKVAARRGSFFEREAQFSVERARKLELKKREKEQAEYNQRPVQREIDKDQADGFVARQLAWESKIEAKRAMKKEEMEETMLANLRDKPEVDAKSLEIAKDIGWNPDRKSFFKAQMAWNSHREADRSAKQSHAAMMEAADLRDTPELSKESRKLAQHAARSAGIDGVDVTERLLAPSSTRRTAASAATSARSADDDKSAEDFTPHISSASKAMVERRSELEAAAGVPRADCLSRLYPSADQPRASRLSVAGGYDMHNDNHDAVVETGAM